MTWWQKYRYWVYGGIAVTAGIAILVVANKVSEKKGGPPAVYWK